MQTKVSLAASCGQWSWLTYLLTCLPRCVSENGVTRNGGRAAKYPPRSGSGRRADSSKTPLTRSPRRHANHLTETPSCISARSKHSASSIPFQLWTSNTVIIRVESWRLPSHRLMHDAVTATLTFALIRAPFCRLFLRYLDSKNAHLRASPNGRRSVVPVIWTCLIESEPSGSVCSNGQWSKWEVKVARSRNVSAARTQQLGNGWSVYQLQTLWKLKATMNEWMMEDLMDRIHRIRKVLKDHLHLP